jgi:hypothetical protein
LAVSFPRAPSYTARAGEAVFVSRDDDGNFVLGNGRMKIAASEDVIFATDVVTDIARIAQSPEGKSVLERGDAIGKPILIRKADPPTEPPNAWVLPDDLTAATGNGAGCGSTVVYDPAQWPLRSVANSPSSDAILLIMLRQANLNAAGKSDPAAPDWGDK